MEAGNPVVTELVMELATTCAECSLHNDHTWWCGKGTDETRAGSRRYFWQD